MSNPTYQSWNLYPRRVPRQVLTPQTAEEAVRAVKEESGPLLSYGLGRSYGDVCLNEGGTLLDLTGMNRAFSFDAEMGILSAEAGISFTSIAELILPRGWFLPTTPGTRNVTLGGAIANDVHGKNQHSAGSFGNWVEELQLLRSDGSILTCSPGEHPELFRATIGGLGLTGTILSATVRLKRVPSAWIQSHNIPFRTLDEFYALSESLPSRFEFLFSWFDVRHSRGIFMAGNWAPDGRGVPLPGKSRVPAFWGGRWLLNRASMRAFNELYWWRASRQVESRVESWDKFFYPLDSLKAWNRLYGRGGFLEYQCLIPAGAREKETAARVMEIIRLSGCMPYLGAVKRFGPQARSGMLSFADEGTSLIFDFPNRGPKTFELLDRIDREVRTAGGRVYPAKDARMSAPFFFASFPEAAGFAAHVDPKFSSSFWRRMHP